MMRSCCLFFILVISSCRLSAELSFEEDVRPIFEKSCVKCHGGEKVKGKVDLSKILTRVDADANFDLWETVTAVIEDGEMPPEEEPQLSATDKGTVLNWHEQRKHAAIDPRPATFRPRRLSGPEYRNTLRSLFGFDLEVAIGKAEQTVTGEPSLVLKLLPTDPPGASGFVNDTHAARLSTSIWNQYSYLTDSALEKLFSVKQREQLARFVGVRIPLAWSEEDFALSQAESLVRKFLPLALRRPVDEAQLAKPIANLTGKHGMELVAATKFELKAILMSPAFLYRGLLMDGEPGKQQLIDAFELAERLSYFLWEDMPDDELASLAADGSLQDPQVVVAQVDRMLRSPKARSLAESFGVQWLLINSLDEQLRKDPIRHHALRSQPIDFLNYLFVENRPVMELIESKVTFVNQGTSGFYGKDRQKLERFNKPKGIERQRTPNQRLILERAEGRGGILTMPGILTMNQGPIQRGTWMLRQILGEHLGEPPADVPAIQPSPHGQNLSFRERFEKHRSDPSCARCHEKIDPLGFALDGYDAKGQFIFASDQRNKKKKSPARPIDTSGKLPSGEIFDNFSELKSILLTSQRETVVRNIVERTLSYALCRKLARSDWPTVDSITIKICEADGTWNSLFQEVANSLPFRQTIIPDNANQE
ncbi:MAG: hypothetical protein ACI9R3_004630 [Verrucomicrobiales bacterium]|jgi:hypothetical protein